MPAKTTPGQAGDFIEVRSPAGVTPVRRGEIVEVLGGPGHEHYRVRWTDGHESIFFPADGTSIVPAEHGELTATGAAAVVEYLEGREARFTVIEHAPTTRAAEEADVAGWAREAMAKTVVLHDGTGYLLAVIPASERLDLHKLREIIGGGREIRLATEEEIAADFPALQVGATPPLGPMLPDAEIIDRRLLDQPKVLCAGGDHRHSIVIDPGELVRLADARVADICAEP